jgi:hypothetical protein
MFACEFNVHGGREKSVGFAIIRQRDRCGLWPNWESLLNNYNILLAPLILPNQLI